MIGMSDRRLAPRRATRLVAQSQKTALSRAVQPPMRLRSHEVSAARTRVEATDPPRGAIVSAIDQGTRVISGNWPVAINVGRLVAPETFAGKQAGLAHHQVDLDRHVVGLPLTGDPLDQQVGHQLSASTVVTGGDGAVGGPAQRRVRGNPLRDRYERCQPSHRVGCRAQGHAAIPLGSSDALHASLWVEAVSEPAGLGLDATITHAIEARRQFTIDVRTILARKPDRLAGHDKCSPLGDPPVPQATKGVR
jgi:hypothetical protein